MSVIPQTPELPGGFAPLIPYQGSALDQLGTLSGPQTPAAYPPPPPPLTTNPGSAPDIINNFTLRRAITKLRISSHRPKIETGRLEASKRLCNKCDLIKIEDEIHFY